MLYTQAVRAYTACMKKKDIQYTVRGVPERTDHQLREKAAEYGLSLNATALKVLQAGLGQEGQLRHHDFDAYAGSWVADETFDAVLQELDHVDKDMWT